MAEEKELYAILGVARGVSQDELRRAYRRLARKFHPDVNPGNKKAEERFKEISAAYDVLSSPERRKLYDEFGMAGLREGFDPQKAREYQEWARGREATGFGGGPGPDVEFDLSDLFGDLFGGGLGGRSRARPGREGQDVLATVEIDFAQALTGAEVQLSVPASQSCGTCGGSGDAPGIKPRVCSTCGGTGKRQAVRGPMRMMRPCETCAGTGRLRDRCPTCQGKGTVSTTEVVTVRIPPGADNGSRLRVPGRGLAGPAGGPRGDLVIETRVRPHRFFRREGLDLYLHLPVTLAEAHDGAAIEVPTPAGSVKLRIPPRTQQGTELRLRGKGARRGREQGDLYVIADVRLPETEDPAVAEALRAASRGYGRPVREGLSL